MQEFYRPTPSVLFSCSTPVIKSLEMMFKEGRLPFASCTALLFLLLAFQGCNARKTKNSNNCPTSSCGTINIRAPFRLNTDPTSCGGKRYNLYCENNSTVALYLENSANQKYYVREIDYGNNKIRVVDAGFDKYDCSSVPRVPLVPQSPSGLSVNRVHFGDEQNPYVLLSPLGFEILFVKCANPVNHPLYIDRSASCRNGSSASAAAAAYRYAIVSENITAGEVMDQCTIEMMSPLLRPFKNSTNISFLEIHRQLAYGFELKWCGVHCLDGCAIDSQNFVCFGTGFQPPFIPWGIPKSKSKNSTGGK